MLKKPIYVGFAVLNLEKWLTYGFHYKFIKKLFDAVLLFTDAEFLQNVYKKFFQWNNLFDFSNYLKDF